MGMKIDWKQVVGSVAPVLATALGGPLAGVAVKAVATGLTGKPDATDAELAAAVTSPDGLLKLREIELQFERDMATMGIDLEKIASADRANARDREARTGDSWTPRAIAGVVVLGYFAVQWFILSHVVPAEQRELVMRSMGVLDTALGLVLGYYFGSSASSREKTTAMAGMTKR